MTDPLPDWLAAPVPIEPENPLTTLEGLRISLPHAYEGLIEQLEAGVPLTRAVRERFGREAQQRASGLLMRYIMRDPARKARYYEAQEMSSEVVAAEALEIADGLSEDALPDDVNRARLKIDVRKWHAGVVNRKRFGDVKQVDVTGSIDLRSVLQRASERVIEGTVIDQIGHDDGE